MATYGGFTSGTFPAWALNLLQNVFGTAGIARGLQVTAPGGMQVQVGVDATALDGVCFLPNGAFFRIDAAVTFNVPSNSSGGTRTDAIVAYVDPTGNSNPNQSLTYQTNWAGGFSGTNNQFVLALVSVASGAVSVASGNISMNSATAKLGNAGGSSNSMVDPDGVGLKVQDNSTTGNLTLVTTGLTTGNGRNVVIAATDKSGNNHYFYCNVDGSLTLAGPVHAVADSASNAVIAANANSASAAQYVLVGGTTPQRIFTGSVAPANATNGDIWINA